MFKLTDEYTAYPGEAEVLVQDGLEYYIKGNIEKFDENTKKTYHLINLNYPAC